MNLGIIVILITIFIAVVWGIPYEIKQSEERLKDYIHKKKG